MRSLLEWVARLRQVRACLDRASATRTARLSGDRSPGDAAGDRSCTDGETVCWGDNAYGQADPPAETFTSVSAGGYHTCGLREDGSLRCWGAGSEGLDRFPHQGQSQPPVDHAIEVAAGVLVTCAVLEGGAVRCWGLDPGGCAESGEWGMPCQYWDAEGPLTPPDGVSFDHVSVDKTYACGLTSERELRCWGSNAFGESDAPSGKFEQVSRRCGLSEDGTVTCWGTPSLRAPTDRFSTISAGAYACGVTAKHVMQCWGGAELGLSPPGSAP